MTSVVRPRNCRTYPVTTTIAFFRYLPFNQANGLAADVDTTDHNCGRQETDMSGTRVSINGIDLYHEVHGTGRALVVLHGGVLNAETCFGTMIPQLAEAHQVIAVDLQGHGHTAD